MKIDNNEILISGKFVKIVQFKEEWDIDVKNPEDILQKLKTQSVKADILTFRQRIPESKPKFKYFLEWDNAAALPIKNYEYWLKHQLHQNPRNKLRISQKKGVIIEICELDDKLISEIMDIYNESPVRQNKKFSDYGLTFEEMKTGLSTFVDRSNFICAFFKNELIGFVKLVNSDRYARTMSLLSKIAHRDKAPMNLLLAKAVEVCANNKMPYLVYGKFKYGKRGSDTFQDFKRYLGFESILLPRYFIPLTLCGSFILKLKLHNGLIEALPLKLVRLLLKLRDKWHQHKLIRLDK